MSAQRGTNVFFTQWHKTHVGPLNVSCTQGSGFHKNSFLIDYMYQSIENLDSPHIVFHFQQIISSDALK